SFFELARQHAHADQVTAMDAFEALCNNGFHAQQTSPFSSPIAGRSGSVFLSGDYDERNLLFLIFHRGIVNAHALTVRLVQSYSAFRSRHHQVLDAHVRKRAAHHHLMIAAPRTIAVEVLNLDSLLLQVHTGG